MVPTSSTRVYGDRLLNVRRSEILRQTIWKEAESRRRWQHRMGVPQDQVALPKRLERASLEGPHYNPRSSHHPQAKLARAALDDIWRACAEPAASERRVLLRGGERSRPTTTPEPGVEGAPWASRTTRPEDQSRRIRRLEAEPESISPEDAALFYRRSSEE